MLPNAECGMRNAELKGMVRSRMTTSASDGGPVYSAFRIPHSAFGTGYWT